MDAKDSEEERIGRGIIQASLAVHSELGPGLLESTYELCLAHELKQRAFAIQRQMPLAIRYRDLQVVDAFRIDLLVGSRVVIEVKALEAVLPVHKAQLLSYLRLGNFKLGYLLNFNVAHMRDGLTRLVNGL